MIVGLGSSAFLGCPPVGAILRTICVHDIPASASGQRIRRHPSLLGHHRLRSPLWAQVAMSRGTLDLSQPQVVEVTNACDTF